jgi:golgi SNAP receptor complex member 1
VPGCRSFLQYTHERHGSNISPGLGPAAATSAIIRDAGTCSRRQLYAIQGLTKSRLDGQQTETLLHTYSQFSAQVHIPAKPTDEEKTIETKLQELLEKVRPPCPFPPNSQLIPAQRDTVISQLSRILDSETTLGSSALKQSNLSLLRDKLADHRRDLSRLRATLSEARSRANLLGSVRDDISAYRAANPEAAEADYMLDERNMIDRSHDTADNVLSQAYAVQEGFALQRERLANINRRITMAASQVPGINTLITRISAKKRRDGIIMGSFVAFCFLMVWFFS